MLPGLHKSSLGARSALLWSLACFLVLQIGFSSVTERWLPEMRDPEYGFKFAALRQRMAEARARPLVLILGSSRSAMGLSPAAMLRADAVCADSRLVFNFSMTGCGPIFELTILRRLLAQGVHPDRLIVEIMPALLNQEPYWTEIQWMHITRCGWNDVNIIKRYTPVVLPWEEWIEATALPFYGHRFAIMSRFASYWLPWEVRQDGWKTMDEWGWLPPIHKVINPQVCSKALESERKNYQPVLFRYRISPGPDAALRELLALCCREKIGVMLLVMPEGRIFRSWYPARAQAMADAYVAGLGEEYHVPVVNARTSMPDSAFLDSHHLLPAAAAEFSARFSREVLEPFCRGKRLAVQSGVVEGEQVPARKP